LDCNDVLSFCHLAHLAISFSNDWTQAPTSCALCRGLELPHLGMCLLYIGYTGCLFITVAFQGDGKYGSDPEPKINTHLHCRSLKFVYEGKNYNIKAQLPKHFLHTLQTSFPTVKKNNY
jgi:hypothetical protein